MTINLSVGIYSIFKCQCIVSFWETPANYRIVLCHSRKTEQELVLLWTRVKPTTKHSVRLVEQFEMKSINCFEMSKIFGVQLDIRLIQREFGGNLIRLFNERNIIGMLQVPDHDAMNLELRSISKMETVLVVFLLVQSMKRSVLMALYCTWYSVEEESQYERRDLELLSRPGRDLKIAIKKWFQIIRRQGCEQWGSFSWTSHGGVYINEGDGVPACRTIWGLS